VRLFAHIAATCIIATTAHAGQHIVIGVVPGDYDVSCGVGRVSSSPLGVLHYEATGPCTVSLSRVDGNGGPSANGCSCTARSSCAPPWNEAWGFYDNGLLVGYIEFHGGLYYTAGGKSFGQGYDTRRVCGVDDWAAVRVEFGLPPDLCVHTLTGLQYCGP